MITSDIALLERWRREQDADAFAELVSRYADMVYNTGRRILADSAQAEDLVQECFIELMQSRRRITSSLGGWLHSVALHRGMDHIRRDARRRRREAAFEGQRPGAAEAADAGTEEILARVDAAIGELPEKLRSAVIARFLEGQSHTDAARREGITESAIRNRVDQGILRIRKSLKRQGIPAATAAILAALSASAEAAPQRIGTNLGKLALANAMPVAQSSMLPVLIKGAAVAMTLVAVATAYWVLRPGRDAAPTGTIAQSTVPEVEETIADLPAPEAEDAAVVVPPPAVEDTPEAAEAFSVSGRVYDAVTGEGIPGVEVRPYPEGGGRVLEASAPTNGEGHYTLPPMPDGTYGLSLAMGLARYPSAETGSNASVTLNNQEQVAGVDFALRPGIRVAGTVVDPRGNAVAGAQVGALAPTVYNAIDTETAGTGTFELYIPEATNDLRIQAWGDSAESDMRTGITLTAAGIDGLKLVLGQPRASAISGHVVDGTGAPMAKANVYLHYKNDRVFQHAGRDATDAQGAFHISDFAPGDFSVIVTPEGTNGFSTTEEYLRIAIGPGEHASGIEIVYGEKGGLAIAGRVVNGKGEPVERATVMCFSAGMERAYTDENGRFQITGLMDQRYGIIVEHSDYSRGNGSFAAGTIDAEIVLKGRGSLVVRMTRADRGTPLKNFTVAFVFGRAQALDEMLYSSGRSVESQDGVYAAGQMLAGELSMAVWAAGFAPQFRTVEVAENDTTEAAFALEPVAPFEGRVTDAAGLPVEDAGIYFVTGVSLQRIDRAFAARSDDEGNFVLESLPKDATQLCAYHPDYGVGVALLPNAKRIILPAPAVVEGKVVISAVGSDPNSVVVSYPDQSQIPSARTQCDIGGAFRLAGLTPGEAELSVQIGGQIRQVVTRRVTLAAGQTTEIHFAIEDGTGTIEGFLLSGGAPVATAALTLEHEVNGQVSRMRTTPSADGSFRYENVASGRSLLKVTRSNGEDPYSPIVDEFEIMLEDGQVLSQEFALSQIR